ncbi:MAG: lipoyl synthase [Candidatus Omnitrophica bacterium]|nr:lipoyl synthase [Candidatus Omnitrophota bacterium]
MPSSPPSADSPAPERTVSRFPVWLRRPLQMTGSWEKTSAIVHGLGLETICESARCPNIGECWSHGNVSFMILGEICTRHCAFCAVTAGKPKEADPTEPQRIADAVAKMKLQYVVVTSPARDDLPDEGAGHFAATLRAIRRTAPGVGVEVLIPDFHGRPELLGQVVAARPEVLSHNMETIRRLSGGVRPQARYERSLEVLKRAKQMGQVRTKSGFMVGLGESPAEVEELMRDLRTVDCDILTIGQYLQPTLSQHKVAEFVPIERYGEYKAAGLRMGFPLVASGPYVRSSYNAYEAVEAVPFPGVPGSQPAQRQLNDLID